MSDLLYFALGIITGLIWTAVGLANAGFTAETWETAKRQKATRSLFGDRAARPAYSGEPVTVTYSDNDGKIVVRSARLIGPIASDPS